MAENIARNSTFRASRRRALHLAARIGYVMALGLAGRVYGAPAPKESGLSFEGLLKDKPGFQPRAPAPLSVTRIPGFLSGKQLEHSYAAYRDAFRGLLAAEKTLRSSGDAGAIPAERYAALRSAQVTSANSVLLHEFYFRNLAARHSEPSRYLLGNMHEHIGSMETWRADFTQCAQVADSWAVLVYDPYDDRWHNLPLGSADAGGMVGTNPLVVCKVSKDAWSLDYNDRETYIARFLEHIAWDVVASRYRAVDRR